MCDTHHGGKGCPPVCGKVSHILAAVLWLLGLLSLVGAWVALYKGVFLSFDASHWYMDVTALSLLGLLAGVNGLFHAVKKGGCSGSCGDEKEGEGSCGCGGACGGHEEKK